MKLYTFDPAPNPQRLKLFIDFKPAGNKPPRGKAKAKKRDNAKAPAKPRRSPKAAEQDGARKPRKRKANSSSF